MKQTVAGQPPPAQKILFELLFELCVFGSVLLTGVGRRLPPTGTLNAFEKRLSRQLGSARWDADALLDQYVAWAARQVRPDTALV